MCHHVRVSTLPVKTISEGNNGEKPVTTAGLRSVGERS
jgi:hypothetical protein